jgi:dTDP-glucose pyrophosphorylase
MKKIGVEKIFIIVSPQNYKLILEILEKDTELDIQYELVVQNFLGGTGHALLLLKDKIAHSRFIVLLGDEYYNDTDSFSLLKSFPPDSNIIGIIEYEDIENITSGCNVIYKDNRVRKLIEKPKETEIVGKWCWDGSAVFMPHIMEILYDMNQTIEKKEKDFLCIVKAMQKMLDRDIPLLFLKKSGININITRDIDLMKSNFLESVKKYDKERVVNLLLNYLTQ